MAWLDDRIRDHPKMVGLSPVAFRQWIFTLCYCSEHGTRGNVDAAIIALRIPKSTVKELLARSLWEERDDGIWIHDWDAHNLKRDQARADRRAFDKRRQQLFRDPELRQQVRIRDRDRCRYCNVEVNWHDRRGPTGATYDHVDPDGENSVDNLVVSCRGCNSQKAGRTPEQARMKLSQPVADLSPGSRSEPRYEPGDTSRARAGAHTNDHDHDQENPKGFTAPSYASPDPDDEPGPPPAISEQPSDHTLEVQTLIAHAFPEHIP
jgi:hypothetical protein